MSRDSNPSSLNPLDSGDHDFLNDESQPARSRGMRSCAECRRRKIKCNRKVPCRACEERGDAAYCRRLPLAPPRRALERGGSENQIERLKTELDEMRRRLARVEAKCGLTADPELASRDEESTDFQESGLAGAMEDAALDIGQVRRWQDNRRPVNNNVNNSRTPHPEGRWFRPIAFNTCLSTLPSRLQCEKLVELYLKDLDWFCGCVHGPTLRNMHHEFWIQLDQGMAEDSMFLSVLFAVLSVAAYLLEDERIIEAGLELESLRGTAANWFDCSLASFFRCHGLAEPSLPGLQAIMVLNYAFHLSRNSKIHKAMFNIKVGMARAINLHLLGDDLTGSAEHIVQREIGRRVWWNVVSTEWYFTSYNRYSNVAPHSFDTALPCLTDEGERLPLNSGSISTLSYLLAVSRSSKVLYDVYGTLRPYQNPTYEAVLAASDQLDNISTSFTSPSLFDSGSSSQDFIKRIIGMTLAYRSYLLHRGYYVKSLGDVTLSKTHSACVRAALTILNLADEGLPKPFYRLWNVTIWLVAAGLVLALDLVKASSDQRILSDNSSRRSRLQELVRTLNTVADESGIGSRGAKLIDHLCSMERNIAAGRRASLAGITRKDILGLVSPTTVGNGDNNSSRPFSQNTIDQVSTETRDGGLQASLEREMAMETLDDMLFLPSSWVGNEMDNLMQVSFNMEGSLEFDGDGLFDFFTDLGT